MDTSNKDFIGGSIEFVDEVIQPFRGLCIIFDSRDIHKVNLLKKGTRRCLVTKFYQPI